MKIIFIPNTCEDKNHQNFLTSVSICHFYVFKSTHDSWEKVEKNLNTDNAFLILSKPTQAEAWNVWLTGASSINANADDMVTPKCLAEHSLASGRSWRRVRNSIWSCSFYKWINLGSNQSIFFFSSLQTFSFLLSAMW